MKESSCGSTFSSAYGVVGVPDSGHSNSCIIVAHCFNLHFREIPGAPMSSRDLIHANSKLENLLRFFFQELFHSSEHYQGKIQSPGEVWGALEVVASTSSEKGKGVA